MKSNNLKEKEEDKLEDAKKNKDEDVEEDLEEEGEQAEGEDSKFLKLVTTCFLVPPSFLLNYWEIEEKYYMITQKRSQELEKHSQN